MKTSSEGRPLWQPWMQVAGEGEEVLPVEPVVLHRDPRRVLPDDRASEGEDPVLRKRKEHGQRLPDGGTQAEDAQPGQRQVLGDRHPDQPRRADLHREIGLDSGVLALAEIGVEELGHARSVSPEMVRGNFLSVVATLAGRHRSGLWLSLRNRGADHSSAGCNRKRRRSPGTWIRVGAGGGAARRFASLHS